MGKSRARAVLIVAVLSLLVASGVLAGCGNQVAKVKTIRPGVLLVGSENTYPPFEMTVGNEFVGFDVDIANAVAARLGLRPQIVKTTFGKIIPGLRAGNYDVALSALTITPERARLISFSDPYMTADQSICVRLGSDIKDQAGLAGKTVGVESGTTGEAKAVEIQKSGGIGRIQRFDNIQIAFEALEIGTIDAIINDYATNAYISDQRGTTKVAQLIKTNENYGIGIRHGDSQMIAGVNKALAAMLDDGSYKAIYKKWLGTPNAK
jgi:polar amino acid transport system substrate-binding protein